EHILGEYYQLNLTSVPRITAVSSFEEAHEQLNQKYFDLIIIMSGADRQIPIDLSSSVNKQFGYIPTYLLANNNMDMSFYQEPKNELKFIDKVFVWNGDSRIFFTITKLLEDKVNVENDTKIGYSRVILLVEDSVKYYSRYLPLLYTSVLNQTKRIIDDVSKMDELYKILRLRARPKVMLATTYEQAIDIFEKYKDNMLCLISDVKFTKGGKLTSDAGFKLVEHVREHIHDLPTVIQSSNLKNEKRAIELNTRFIHKNTEALLQEIRNFISVNLGFGNFIFKDINGHKYEVAKNLNEFKQKLKIIPAKSISYHAGKNHFSLWLTARGEIQIAKLLAPLKISDFQSIEHLRNRLINVIDDLLKERTKGKIVGFRENSVWDESSIARLASGALGGKGRGLAFVNSLLYSFDLSEFIPEINLRTPRTAIIGIDEYEAFLEDNELSETIYELEDYQLIKKKFLNAHLSDRLIEKMKMLLEQTNKPLAVRSSGLFEDSLMQPFAGVFSTYILPNSHEDLHIRLKQACEAIKLVFSSVFSKTSRDYVNAINYKIEEERMAVVIQELVGTKHNNVYYPQISGTAQSYNYYPFGHIEPEDGFAVSAIGLGTYVVSGEKSYRFSPKHPTLSNNSPKDQFRNSQVEFYAVNLDNKNIDLLQGEDAGLVRLDIEEAEIHGNLKHCASVYDQENKIISPGLDKYGPRIINFANILKYNYIPLAETISSVLDIVKEALGSPVEIEFAVDLNKDKDRKATFYLLQIKPLIGNANDYNINMDEVIEKSLILYTENGMGNGQVDDITDIIYVDKSIFDKSKTNEIALEIESFNNKMIKANKNYVLIGPGRWGTRDPWIGIPVKWTQISNAKIIVETSLEDFPLDASAGSHFFHNVTSMNVGYFSIQHH
ncbi:MAG: pyruvate, phosphate dikinase, partial [Bacteroidetes bacterium]